MEDRETAIVEELPGAVGNVKAELPSENLNRTLFLEKLLGSAILGLLIIFVLQFWIYSRSGLWMVDQDRGLGVTLSISLGVALVLGLLLVMRWKHLRKEFGWRDEVDRRLRLLKAAAETMEIGITISNIEGKIRYVNRAEAEMHGYVVGDVLGRESRIFAPEESWDPQSLVQLKESGRFKRESLNIRKDGVVFPVQLISDIVFGRDGGPVGIVTSCEDISDRKEREQELMRSRQDLKALTHHLEEVRDTERSQIAHEIHNDLGAALTVLKMDLVLMEKAMIRGDAPPVEKLHSMEENIDGMIDRIRRLSRQLRPFLLDDAGLEAAIEWYAKDFVGRTGIPIDLEIPECSDPIGEDHREILFRTFQEGVTNALRHASPERIQVSLEFGKRALSIRVSDDGVGYPGDPTRYSNAFGLLALRERAESAGGHFEFHGVPNEGSTLKVSIPREEAAQDDLGFNR